MKHFIQKHHKKIVIIAPIAILIVCGCLFYDNLVQAAWTLPFVYKPVAITKTTSRDTGEIKYYTIYANGKRSEFDAHELDEYTDRDNRFVLPKNTSLNDFDEELSKAVHELNLMDSRYFRDGDIFFIAGMRDCGFGTSFRNVYAYDMSNRRMNYLNQFPTDTEFDWIYTKQ